ncbi:hypothetical protein FRC17_002379, partial [Serendipita sp. 399]
MQTQHDNSSEEVLSMYRKRGYEYVEEEKTVLDELVTLYRKRFASYFTVWEIGSSVYLMCFKTGGHSEL